MAPSSSTPNFSRPLVSPMSTGDLDTPLRGSRAGLILDEPPHTASLVNMPKRSSPGRVTPSKRLFNIPGDQNRGPAEKKGASAQASTVTEHLRSFSKLSITGKDGSQSPVNSVDVAGRDKPIPDFRPEFWPRLDKQREALSIDLFWPIKLDKKGDEEQDNEEQDDDEEDKDVFPYAGLEPLVTFHNLRHLQINGMMRSYQPLIFATCWVNKNLTRVHLEMALEPEMKPTSKDTKLKHRLINDKWSPNVFNKKQPGYCEYLGHHGEGVLHEEFGYGEYLDQQAIKVAQLSVGIELPQENLQFLPITHLTLRNFVVDAGPFFRWFDSARLQEIVFLGDCVDAGFYLPPAMKPTIKFTAPKPLNVARWVKPGEIKLVDIKKRKSTPIQGDGDGNSGPALLNNKPSPAMLNSEVNTKDNDNKVAKGKNEEITKDEGKEQENNKQVG